MDKKILIGIIVVIVAVIGAGLFLAFNDSNMTKDISPLTSSFDYSMDPITEWNKSTKEFSFEQEISSVNGNDYKDIKMNIEFYSGGQPFDTHEVTVDSTENGKFKVNFTEKLDSEPEEIYYDVISATEV